MLQPLADHTQGHYPQVGTWGPGAKGARAVNGWPGMWGGSDGDPFYTDLNGGLNRTYGADASGTPLLGYRVIGCARSQTLRPGAREFAGTDYEEIIKTHQRVLVLGVKPFATREEANAWLTGSGDPVDQ